MKKNPVLIIILAIIILCAFLAGITVALLLSGSGGKKGTSSGIDPAAAEVSRTQKDEEKPDRTGNPSLTWQENLTEVINERAGELTGCAFYDIDGDSVPELLCYTNDTENVVDVIKIVDGQVSTWFHSAGGALVFEPAERVLYRSWTGGNTAHDQCLELRDGEWQVFFDGSIHLSQQDDPYDMNLTPILTYRKNDAEVDGDIYLAEIRARIYDRETVDLAALDRMTAEDAKTYLASGLGSNVVQPGGKEPALYQQASFDFERDVQFFTAAHSGVYHFDLFGASGGPDDRRNHTEEEQGAYLGGDLRLRAGQHVAVVTGGVGDMYAKGSTVIGGGFNGGGNGYSSGGGGGCTDIYLEETRIAAAAGGGGGNFDQEEHGKMGRVSSETGDHTTTVKKGGSDDRIDCGGGGGGWYGGMQGENDGAGWGGVNGWNEEYFSASDEEGNCAYDRTGSYDGSAVVSYAGK